MVNPYQNAMKSLIFQLILSFLAAMGLVNSVSAQSQDRGLQNYQSLLNGTKTLVQLSAEELREVIVIYQRLLDDGSTSRATPLPSYKSQDIQIAHKNKLFIINGSKYEAYTSCFDFEMGDKVIFLDGTPRGQCLTTQLLNIRTDRTCKIWCQ